MKEVKNNKKIDLIIKNIRKYFPFFTKNKDLIYFDSATTSLTLMPVIKVMNNYYINNNFNNNNPNNFFSYKINEEIKATRKIISDYLGKKQKEIFFNNSTTSCINQIAFSINYFLKKSDEIILTYAEHASNLLPWLRLAKEKKLKIKYMKFNKNGEIDINKIKQILSPKTKIVSFAPINNSFSAINNTKEITKLIKKYSQKIFILVDCAQTILHLRKSEIKKWNIDFLVFSMHKIFGPYGIGVLWIKKKLLPILEPLIIGSGTYKKLTKKNFTYQNDNKKFEAGTQNIIPIIASKEVFKFLKKVDSKKIKKHISTLKKYCWNKMKKMQQVKLYEYNKNCSSFNLFFNLNFKNKIHHHDIISYFASKKIFFRGGNLCAPLLNKIFREDKFLRINFNIYNNLKEVKYFLKELKILINDIENNKWKII